MKLRDSIFDNQEKNGVFSLVRSRWSAKVELYPSLSLAKIVEAEPREFTAKEFELFYKTSLDYTFCQEDGRPFLSIDFDEIGGGFSRDGIYIPIHQIPDDTYVSNRKQEINFKLKVAKALDYPLVVVSYEEIKPLEAEEAFTILDGIVGRALAKWRFERYANEILETSEKGEDIQGLLWDAEMQAELEENPIAQKAAEYDFMAYKRYGNVSCEVKYLDHPPLPNIKGDLFVDMGLAELKAIAEAKERVVQAGCQVILKAPELGIDVIFQTVWVRNFAGFGIFPHSIAENIAKYLAYKRLFALADKEA